MDFSLVLSLNASSVTIADPGDIEVNTSLVWVVEKLWWKEGDFRNTGENAKTENNVGFILYFKQISCKFFVTCIYRCPRYFLNRSLKNWGEDVLYLFCFIMHITQQFFGQFLSFPFPDIFALFIQFLKFYFNLDYSTDICLIFYTKKSYWY